MRNCGDGVEIFWDISVRMAATNKKIKLPPPVPTVFTKDEYTANKEIPCIVVKEKTSLNDLDASNIIGINKYGTFLILNGAVSPTVGWTKYVFAKLPVNVWQPEQYTTHFGAQSELLGDLQQILLDANLTSAKNVPNFATPIIKKYEWAFKKLAEQDADPKKTVDMKINDLIQFKQQEIQEKDEQDINIIQNIITINEIYNYDTKPVDALNDKDGKRR